MARTTVAAVVALVLLAVTAFAAVRVAMEATRDALDRCQDGLF